LSLIQTEPSRVLLDRELVLDGVTSPPPLGAELFGLGSAPIETVVELDAGRAYEIVAEYTAGESVVLHGVQLGCRAAAAPDLLERAVAAAEAADAVILVVGTNDDCESGGRGREFLDLPGGQPELLRPVAAADPCTA